MPQILTPEEFLNAQTVILDTRSPIEFAAGHIPGAISFPLFSDQERAEVGICYKQAGQDCAIELGLELVGPKLANFVRQAKQLVFEQTSQQVFRQTSQQTSPHQVRLHCWRGGMRSSSMAWLLETAGFQVQLLQGGYKAFRRWVRATLACPKPILTLGGMTGTGKTSILAALAQKGEPILDLEHWANHRGSSYGALGLPAQPTQEQFDNQLAIAWAKLSPDRPIWIEAESRRIGLCRVPDEIFQPMLRAPILQVERSRDERLDILQSIYGPLDPTELITATQRIARKIGGQQTNAALAYLQQGNLRPAMDIVLNYYDKTYLYDLQRRGVTIYPINAIGLSDHEIADRLITQAQQL
jgi:tRNA 2-selenouridine synthase